MKAQKGVLEIVSKIEQSTLEAGPDGGEPTIDDVSLGRRFFNLQTLLSFIIAFAILYFVITKIDVDFGQIVSRLKTANPLYYLLAVLVYYMSFFVRARRWDYLLRNVGFSKREGIHLPPLAGITRIILLSWFANCIMPAKLGDAYRGYLLKQAAGVSFSKTLGTILAERIIDLSILFSLLALAGLRVFHGTVPEVFGSMLISGTVMLVLIGICLIAMLKFGGLVERLLPASFREVYRRFEEGTLLSFQNLPVIVVLTVSIWAMEAGRLWFILASLSVQNVPISVVLFVALASSLLTTVPMTPAGLGIVESALIGLILLLSNVGAIPATDQVLAASIAVLDRTISYWSLVLVGCLVYLFTKRKGIHDRLRRFYCASASITPRR